MFIDEQTKSYIAKKEYWRAKERLSGQMAQKGYDTLKDKKVKK